MNTPSYRANARTPNTAIEHTPIYDLAAYYQRKRQHQRKQRFKNFIDGITFICMSAITFSMLFLGK